MKAIPPHITMQPIRGKKAIRLATPIIGTKIMSPTMTTIIIPTTQGFKHLLHELKNLFIAKSYTSSTKENLKQQKSNS